MWKNCRVFDDGMFHCLDYSEDNLEWLEETASPAVKDSKGDDWISVEDRLPDNRQRVLCLPRQHPFAFMCEHSWEAHTDQDDKWFMERFSHWKILPALPKI